MYNVYKCGRLVVFAVRWKSTSLNQLQRWPWDDLMSSKTYAKRHVAFKDSIQETLTKRRSAGASSEGRSSLGVCS